MFGTKIVIILAVLLMAIALPVFAGTVGNCSDASVPEGSLQLKEKIIGEALDDCELNLKAGFDIEVIPRRKLRTSDDDSNIKMQGVSGLVKLSNNWYDVFEPYIKVGTSWYEVTWTQHSNKITVDSDPGLTVAGGFNSKLWEFNNGVKLSFGIQFTDAQLDIDKARMNGSVSLASASQEKFEIKEWQYSLIATKKYILPLEEDFDLYIVPYGGFNYTDLDVDVSFVEDGIGTLYSTYNASDKNAFGILLGVDVMPSLSSWYLLNFELRLLNEIAFSLGGTAKF
jgi:hypothetical protein